MTSNNHSDKFCCVVCEKKNKTMKRCTRCRQVYYCSRECQVKDWPDHKSHCGDVTITQDQEQAYVHVGHRQRELRGSFTTDDGSIFTDNQGLQKSQMIHHTSIDFQKAANELQSSQSQDRKDNSVCSDKHTSKDDGQVVSNGYLMYDQYYYDFPVLDKSQPYCDIVIKANKQKQTLSIQDSWNGTEVYKVFSHRLKIPLDKIKVIHKGKVMNPQTIQSAVKNKAIFQVIGEQAANEEGVDISDINCLMKQLSVSRNDAILALRKTGNIIDAIFEVENK